MPKGKNQPRSFSAGAFLELALPMIISRSGLAAMGIADGIMVSRFGTRSFASLSLAEGTLGRLLDVFVAFLIGGLSLVPRHFAQGDSVGARAIWLRTVPVSLALGGFGLIVSLFGQQILLSMGQTPELARGAAPVMAILGAGYPAALLAISAALYLEGIQRPHFVAACVVAANGMNILLNWVLIGGHFGLAAMGARGSALSTTITRCALGLVLAGFAWRMRTADSHKTSEAHLAERRRSERSQWHLGFGTAASIAVIVLLTSSLTIFAGWLGVIPLATFAAAWSVAAPAALVALGMSDAAGIFVSAESGRKGDQAAAQVAWSSLRMALSVVGVIAIGLTIFAGRCAGFYTADPAVRGAIASVIPIAACVLTVDSVGFVMAASLRGIKQIAWPAGIEIFTMLLLVPIAASLAFTHGLGVRGLFLAMLSAGIARTALLAARFGWKTRHLSLRLDATAKAGA